MATICINKEIDRLTITLVQLSLTFFWQVVVHDYEAFTYQLTNSFDNGQKRS